MLLFVDKCGQVASVGKKQFTQVYGNTPLPKTVTKTMERDFLQFSPQTNRVNYCMNANQLCKYTYLDLTVYCLFDIGLGLWEITRMYSRPATEPLQSEQIWGDKNTCICDFCVITINKHSDSDYYIKLTELFFFCFFFLFFFISNQVCFVKGPDRKTSIKKIGLTVIPEFGLIFIKWKLAYASDNVATPGECFE